MATAVLKQPKFIELIEYRSIRSRGVRQNRSTGNNIQVGISSIVFGELVDFAQVKEGKEGKEGKEPLPLARFYLANGRTILGVSSEILLVEVTRWTRDTVTSELLPEENPIFVNTDRVESIIPFGVTIIEGKVLKLFLVKTPVSSFVVDSSGVENLVGQGILDGPIGPRG
jgi:hypothetical protein